MDRLPRTVLMLFIILIIDFDVSKKIAEYSSGDQFRALLLVMLFLVFVLVKDNQE